MPVRIRKNTLGRTKESIVDECKNNTVRVLDELMKKVGDDENHPLASLMEILGTLIENYESRHFPETASDPVGTLKFLMKEHGLKQGDLSEIGSQGVVSEILKGRRELNVRQIKALSHRFNVSPAVFVQQKMGLSSNRP